MTYTVSNPTRLVTYHILASNPAGPAPQHFSRIQTKSGFLSVLIIFGGFGTKI